MQEYRRSFDHKEQQNISVLLDIPRPSRASPTEPTEAYPGHLGVSNRKKKGKKVQHAGEPGEISMIKTYINQTGKGALSKHKSLIFDRTYADINTMRVKTEDRGAGKVY